MKLRFKGNTLRLRLNQSEVRRVAEGIALEENVFFPGCGRLSYVLRAEPATSARFESGLITVCAPLHELQTWAASGEIGLYFELPADPNVLKVAVEKDLECIDSPPAERDPDAFPRPDAARTC